MIKTLDVMTAILVLISPETQAVLSSELVDSVKLHLGYAGILSSGTTWLKQNTAAEFTINGLTEKAIAMAKQKLANLPVDVLRSPPTQRRKKILLLDMDSTLIQGETLDELAALYGVGDQVADITARAMRGEIKDYASSLRERIKLMKDFSLEQLEPFFGHMQPNPGAKTLIQTMKKMGAYTAVVTGGFVPLVEHAKKLTGFDAYACNKWREENGRLTGHVIDPIIDGEGKKSYLQNLCQQKSITPEMVLAAGDGSNDLPMLRTAGLGVAYYAKDKVKAEIPNQINHTDLNSLLYLQGIAEKEFAHG